MRVGVCCAGIGAAATGDFIRRSAQAAERAGFVSFWIPDHVVLFQHYPESVYPYADYFNTEASDTAANARVPMTEPVLGMTWAAAATTKIEIGTNVIVLPQRNPLVLAKQLATLDEFSGGRIAFGAGVGWAKEEFRALNADWDKRGKRMDEYIAVMRALWREGPTTFAGETFSFEDAYLYPKPVRGGIPILLGGESEPALKRIARVGDGWFAFRLLPHDAKRPIEHLKQLTREQGRDPEALRIFAPVFASTPISDLERYREAGVTDFYVVLTGQIPIEDVGLNAMMKEMSERFVAPLQAW
jgi:probable F420-dependent oxidoreductase